MQKIIVLSASVRTGKKSNRVALFFEQYIKKHQLADVELLDLEDYDFPIFHERLRFLKNPSEKLIEFSARIKAADGIVLVTPEYNGGYPASLKNAVDVLYDEWKRKPIAISTVSDGPFGGNNVITSIQYSLWKIGALTVPALFPVARVMENYDEHGVPANEAFTGKLAHHFLEELKWYMEAVARMKN